MKFIHTLLATALLLGTSIALATDADEEKERISSARSFLLNKITAPQDMRARIGKIQSEAEDQAGHCKTQKCIYSKYIDAIYKATDELTANKHCPITMKQLIGRWNNTKGYGNYEHLSLASHKGKPSTHEFITFKKTPNDIEDGFGGWKFHNCEITTIETTSSTGRIFNPGNNIRILEYKESDNTITVLDGEFLTEYVRID